MDFEIVNSSDIPLYKWDTLSDAERLELLTQTDRHMPHAILPFIALGIMHNSSAVRLAAKKALKRHTLSVTVPVWENIDQDPEKRHRSALFAATLYREMKYRLFPEDMPPFLGSLLEMGGMGPFYAWQFFTQEIIYPKTFIEQARSLPERVRLSFAFRYMKEKGHVKRLYAGHIQVLLSDLKERDTLINFFAFLFDENITLDAFWEALWKRHDLYALAMQYLLSKESARRVAGLKNIGVFGQPNSESLCLPHISPKAAPSVRLTALKVLARLNVQGRPIIIQLIKRCLMDASDAITLEALRTMIALKIPIDYNMIAPLMQQGIEFKTSFFDLLHPMGWNALGSFLQTLPDELANETRLYLIRKTFRDNPEKIQFFLNQYENNPDHDIRFEAQKFLRTIDQLLADKIKALLREHPLAAIDNPITSSVTTERKAEKKQQKRLQQLIESDILKNVSFQGQALSELDLSGKSLSNIDFQKAVFVNCDLSATQLSHVDFTKASFFRVKLNQAVLDNVSFRETRMYDVSFERTQYQAGDFSGAHLMNVQFIATDLIDGLFTRARLCKTLFKALSLFNASFAEARFLKVDFHHVNLYDTDFAHTRATQINFLQSNAAAIASPAAISLQQPVATLEALELPPIFFESAYQKAGWFQVLRIIHEMERQYQTFLAFNARSKELAFDGLSKPRGDLFELIPFLIHYPVTIKEHHAKTYLTIIDETIPAGIANYVPCPHTVKTARKYIAVNAAKISPNDTPFIEGLFTIGSTGSIAQTENSGIDYWVCIQEQALAENRFIALKQKLNAVEQWSAAVFKTKIHFFIVDLNRIRKKEAFTHDPEHPDVSLGKILVEEFYRTMIHIAGKVPFWCVIPPKLNLKYLAMSPKYQSQYIDLGNIDAIPGGEYFTASMWQIIKSQGSPFKSVIKMALLEKNSSGEDLENLLCNKLKSRWASGKIDYITQDPYVMLLDEVMEYYHQTGQKKAAQLVHTCFFLKLDLKEQESGESRRSIFGIREKLLTDYIDGQGWDMASILANYQIQKWPFKKRKTFIDDIKEYMLTTFSQMSTTRKEFLYANPLISPQALTVLARKMFVIYSQKPNKVETLPLYGAHRFRQFYFSHERMGGPQSTVWALSHGESKVAEGAKNEDRILIKMNRIEAIAIWIIHNRLIHPNLHIHLLPNPTHVWLQDIWDLLYDLETFFRIRDDEKLSPTALLDQPKLHKLYLIINFTKDRKSKKIFEFSAIYVTTWGELYCQYFENENGFDTIMQAMEYVKNEINLPEALTRNGHFMPSWAKKRIPLH